MTKTKVLIVDDEDQSSNDLRYLIEDNFSNAEVTGVANSVADAKDQIACSEPDLVYLDIMMPGLDGFSLIELFPDRKFEVVVTSASPEFGIQGIKHGAIDYILKPATLDDVSSSFVAYKNSGKTTLLREDAPSNQNRIAITTSNGFLLEDLSKIVRFEADNNYTVVHLDKDKSLMVSRPLKDFEVELQRIDKFVRVHKSHIINIDFIKYYSNSDGGHVMMSDGTTFPVSKRKNPIFFDAISKVSLMIKP